MACNSDEHKTDFQTGDILFRGRLDSSLSKAIDAVTQTDEKHHYTHMGVVEVVNDTVWVLHAAPGKGVCKELLSELYEAEDSMLVVGHFRIKEINQTTVEKALLLANEKMGEPYNYSYIMEDSGYYCSEYLYEIYKGDSVFQLNPMTFIDPVVGDFHDGWIKHYNDLGISIPEGQPGCNPNGMAANKRLEFLRLLNE